jgi:hypothetical protein
MHLKIEQYLPMAVTDPAFTVRIEDDRVVLEEWQGRETVRPVLALTVSIHLEDYLQLLQKEPKSEQGAVSALLHEVREQALADHVPAIRHAPARSHI